VDADVKPMNEADDEADAFFFLFFEGVDFCFGGLQYSFFSVSLICPESLVRPSMSGSEA